MSVAGNRRRHTAVGHHWVWGRSKRIQDVQTNRRWGVEALVLDEAFRSVSMSLGSSAVPADFKRLLTMRIADGVVSLCWGMKFNMYLKA